MVGAGVLWGLAGGMLFSLILPFGGLIWMRKRFCRSVKPFFIGMAVFAVFQLFTRIPLLQAVLPLTGWFQQMAQIPWLYSLFLGLTAGIFEETGRYLAFRFVLKKERRFEDVLLFGLGHAGMEMIALLGLTYLNNILLALMLNSGMLDTLPGLDAAAIELLTQQLSGITLPLIGVALYERLVTLALHMGFSVLVLYSVRAKRPVRIKEKSDSGVQVSYAVKEGNPFWFLLAVLLHGAIDSMIGLLPYYFGVEAWGLELVFTLFTALLAGGVFLLKRRFDAEDAGDAFLQNNH